MNASPHAILIGGANGAGKTTFARQALRVAEQPVRFLNADEIQRVADFNTPLAAGKELLRQLRSAVEARESFAIETTLSSLSYAIALQDWRAAGYVVTLHFIELPSADFAVERVRRRVAAGGHGIPEADIRRRFARGLKNFIERYRDSVDHCYHWRSDDDGIRPAVKP